MQPVLYTYTTEAAALPLWISAFRSAYRRICTAASAIAVWLLFCAIAADAVAQTDVDAVAQTDTVKRETVFVEIKVNNRSLPKEEWSDIVIGQRDSITFEVRCRISGGRTDPMLFHLVLRNEKGVEYIDNVNSPSVQWKGLEPMGYIFTVYAFAPGLWEAMPVVVGFHVDNAEAARREQQRISAAVRSDSTAVNTPTPPIVQWGVYVLIAIAVVAGILAIIVQSVRQRRRTNAWEQSAAAETTNEQHLQHTVDKDSTMANPGTFSYEQLQKENSALRAEIAALRGQIEALQVRTDELQKTNRDLAGQKERLLDHKRQLEELQAQKDELFSMVVHDIKNPAGLIRGLVELLRSYDLTAQEQQEIMEDLMATSSRILSLAQEVSRIVTLESGAMKLDFVRYPVGRIIEDVCRRNQAAAVKKNIEVQRDTSSILPDVEIDVNKMEEVLDNLVSNAIKFSDNGSSVKVRAGKTSERVVVEVIDNGPGLTEEDIKRAFGRGARLSAKPTGGESSSGLGLWIVKKIVEAHHGRVWVKSSILKGSTFAFELPLVQPAAHEGDRAGVA